MKLKPKAPVGPVKTSWEKVAPWYTDYLAGPNTLQSEVIFPRALKLLAPEKGSTYLDIACGEGMFSRLITQETKAQVIGIDAASSLIAVARKKAPPGNTYQVADAKAYSKLFPYTAFDGAICILAIQNIEPMQSVFTELAKVLKPRRPFVLVMNHPAFRPPQASDWGWDEKEKRQYRKIEKYLSPYEAAIVAHPGSAPKVKTYSYHRPLQAYVEALSKAGFVIDAIEEWVSNKKSDSGPRAAEENRVRAEIPLFLALRAYKPK